MTDDRPKARLFVGDDLAAGIAVTVGEASAHYLHNVLRLAPGDRITVFNGRDGEWRVRIAAASRRAVTFAVDEPVRPQRPEPGPWLAFAPLKKDALDVLVEKATELGAERLMPVWTARTVVARVQTDRLRAQVREAAEQCERLTMPAVAEPVRLDDLMTAWPLERRLLVLDEQGQGVPLAGAIAAASPPPPGFLVGPEGGFLPSELDAFAALPFVSRVRLGPRILRAETAAIAALAAWQAVAGDWTQPPPPRPGRSGTRGRR